MDAKTIEVKTVYTKDGWITTLKLEDGREISKSWKRTAPGHYTLDQDDDWTDDESLDGIHSRIIDAADHFSTGVVEYLHDLENP